MKSRTSSKRVSSKFRNPQLDDLSTLQTSCSGPSSPTTMSMDSPILRPSSLICSDNGALRRVSCSGSREQLIYTKHRDGLLNENKVTFDDVNFCFACDENVTPSSLLYRTLEKTGYKLDKTDGQLPVYRVVFLCPQCQETVKRAKLRDHSFSLRITLQALAYFSVPK